MLFAQVGELGLFAAGLGRGGDYGLDPARLRLVHDVSPGFAALDFDDAFQRPGDVFEGRFREGRKMVHHALQLAADVAGTLAGAVDFGDEVGMVSDAINVTFAAGGEGGLLQDYRRAIGQSVLRRHGMASSAAGRSSACRMVQSSSVRERTRGLRSRSASCALAAALSSCRASQPKAPAK